MSLWCTTKRLPILSDWNKLVDLIAKHTHTHTFYFGLLTKAGRVSQSSKINTVKKDTHQNSWRVKDRQRVCYLGRCCRQKNNQKNRLEGHTGQKNILAKGGGNSRGGFLPWRCEQVWAIDWWWWTLADWFGGAGTVMLTLLQHGKASGREQQTIIQTSGCWTVLCSTFPLMKWTFLIKKKHLKITALDEANRTLSQEKKKKNL